MNLIKQWNTFSSAPHRMFFFGGMIQSLMTLTWWLIDLMGRSGGLYPPILWTISPTDAHAFLMIYGFFPFFIFGFLMTTYPRWMNGEEVNRREYVPAFLLLSAGALLLYVGLIADSILLKIALILFLAGWGVGLYSLLLVYVRAKNPDKQHATIISALLALGWLLIAGFASDEAWFMALARIGGIWLILLPIFFAVSYRMIPFFSSNVIPDYKVVRPGWAFALILGGSLLHGVLEIAGQQHWTWLVDFPMAVSAIYLSYVWRLRDSLAFPILAVLHIGFAWLGFALLLYTAQSFILLTTDQLIFAKAPLHSLAVGYFTSMLLAMSVRVTLGHSGRALKIDRLTWVVFIIFQSVVVLRVISEIPGLTPMLRNHLYICTGVIWLACFSVWVWKLSPMYWKPRLDGKPG